MSLALCSSWLSQAQDASHHGRHGPQDSYVEGSQVQFLDKVFYMPVGVL